jgi:PhnB protein
VPESEDKRTMKVNPVPEDCHSVTPYLTVPDAARLIEFLKKAFGGIERARISRPDGTVLHAQVRVGDSLLMIGEPQGQWKPRPSTLYFYVPNIDATYKQAMTAGATSVIEPATMFYGDRTACVRDVAENDWWIATRIENPTLEQIQERATAFFKQKSP